jgi:hypothetical protein
MDRAFASECFYRENHVPNTKITHNDGQNVDAASCTPPPPPTSPSPSTITLFTVNHHL